MIKEAKFILNKPNADIETHILLKFTCTDRPLVYSTQQKIHPSEWDSKLQRTFKNRSVNYELDRLYRIIEKFQESKSRLGEKTILKDELRRELDSKTDRQEKAENVTNFFTYYSLLIQEAEEGKLLTPKDKKKYTPGTLKNWKKTKDRLMEFNPDLQFNSITLETYHSFISFCNRRNYAANYTGLLIKDWKTIMKISHGRKWHNNTVYLHPDFRKLTEESDQIYLNEDEIQLLYKHDLSSNKYLETIRDRFIINLYNGLRVSDMKTLNLDNFQNGLITHINQKTTKKVVIPVHEMVNSIIDKYNGNLPRQYHQNVVNREIKIIAREAGLTDKVRFSKTVGGINKKFIKDKCDMITNHTSRRSMATNLLKYVNVIEAMPVMGMSLKTLQLYNKISAEENAITLQKNAFFKTK